MTVQAQKRILEALQKIDRPGTFCTSGRLPTTIPGLEVTGIGPISLPLDKRQATALKKHSRQAPYGKGTQTLVDIDVRRVWEIDADRVVLANPEWPDAIKQAVHTVQSALGLEKQKLDAHLYKLLLYEPGSFFLSHRDGEKLDRMVATLVIALPSVHAGGELVVRHEGREEIVDFGPQSRFQAQFSAFYADCEHEIRPVTSGFRLALVYNLTLEKSKKTIAAPTSSEHISALAHILNHWDRRQPKATDSNTDASPSKLAVLLDHQYTQAGLTRDVLKGVDRAKADVLFAAAQQAGYDASLALVTHWESGSAEPTGDYGYGHHSNDDGSYVIGEVFDESLTAENFSDVDGNPLAFGCIPLRNSEIVSETPLSEREPDEEDFEGYTGNAGMTLERWYHRAAVLLWPTEARFDVLCEAGIESAVGGLQLMVKQWNTAKKGEQTALKQTCLEFANRIIANWPERQFGSRYGLPDFGDDDEDFDDDGDADYGEDEEDDRDDSSDDRDRPADGQHAEPRHSQVSLLTVLQRLGDATLIAAWIRGPLTKDASVNPGKALADVCKQYGWLTFRTELRRLFATTTNETLERHAELLANFVLRPDQKDADCKTLCISLADDLISAVERWNPDSSRQSWQVRTVDLLKLLPPLTQSLLILNEPELLDRLVTYVIDRPKEFDVKTVQVPALMNIEGWLRRHVKQPCPSLGRWLTAVHEKLESRVDCPPQKPTDWRRDSNIDCTCSLCKDLSRFLSDPRTETLRLPLTKERRQHLHRVIEKNLLDTTHVTERRGRPFTLVCTKTKASYERAVEAHRVDRDQLAKIAKLLELHNSLKEKGKRKDAGK